MDNNESLSLFVLASLKSQINKLNADVLNLQRITANSSNTIDASAIVSGTIDDARLSHNIALKLYVDKLENGKLSAANNLSELSNVAIARLNLGLGSFATKIRLATADIPDLSSLYVTQTQFTGGGGSVGSLIATNNLSDLTNVAIARSNLGLGSFSLKNNLITSDIPDISATYVLQTQLSGYATQAQLTTTNNNVAANTTAISGKQATLISGTNIKTINGISVLGGGDIVISSGSGSVGITDNLTTSTTGTALDAHQGFVLKGLVDGKLTASNNLSDVADVPTSRTNLGLGAIATKNTLVAGDIPDISATYATQSQLASTNTNVATNTTNIAGKQAQLNGTGYVKQASTVTSYVASIPNADLANSTISGIALGSSLNSLAAADNTVTLSGTYNGAAARTIAVNLGNNNVWTATKTTFNAAPTATANNGVLNLGSAAFDGTTTGFFVGSSAGTHIAINAVSGFTGRFFEAQLAGVSKHFFDNSGNAYHAGKVGVAITSPSAILHITGGNSTAGNFNNTGLGFALTNGTYTSTTSSGTITPAGIFTIGVPTITATNATTITDFGNFYIVGAPSAGTNVTITNPYALYVASGNAYFASFVKTNRFVLGLSSFTTSGIATTSGSLLSISSGIVITDTITAASGTVAHGAVNAIAPSAIAATNTSVTYTIASTLYISGAPTPSSNVAITTGYAFYINNGNFRMAGTSSTSFIDGKLGIGVTSAVATTAAVEIASTTKGFLPPRMTTTQRDAISSPATGLTIYTTDATATDSSTGVLQVFNGTVWKNAW